MADVEEVPKEVYVELLAALVHGLNAAQLDEQEQVVEALDRMKVHAPAAVEFLFGRCAGLMMFIDAILGDLEDEDGDPSGLKFEDQVEALAEELRSIERGDVTVEEIIASVDEIELIDPDELARSKREHPSTGEDDWPDWLRSL